MSRASGWHRKRERHLRRIAAGQPAAMTVGWIGGTDRRATIVVAGCVIGTVFRLTRSSAWTVHMGPHQMPPLPLFPRRAQAKRAAEVIAAGLIRTGSL